MQYLLDVSSSREVPMRSFVVRKRQTQPRVRVYLEELEGRALLSVSLQPLPLLDTVYSANWSGYAAETNLTTPKSNAVTQVSGSWNVPTVTGDTNAYSAVWVGIDGYSSNSVEQIGTAQDTSRSGVTTYYAWLEMYPNPSVQITSIGMISPGDSISASVTYNNGAFTLQMTDNTTHKSSSTTQTATAQRSSAEWIVEAPSSFFGVLPLADFGTVTFSGAQATINGTTGAIDNTAWQNTSIGMVTNFGTLIDQTSGLTDTTTSPIASSFSVTYSGTSGRDRFGSILASHHNATIVAAPSPASGSGSTTSSGTFGVQALVTQVSSTQAQPVAQQATVVTPVNQSTAAPPSLGQSLPQQPQNSSPSLAIDESTEPNWLIEDASGVPSPTTAEKAAPAPAPDQKSAPAPDQKSAPAPDQMPADEAPAVSPAPAPNESVDDPATGLLDEALARISLSMAARRLELPSGPTS
ncbi:G1 family glutamic endopeptidase, partial [Mycobacterium sp.]|uniref:G1 family glutamic endopeptidase n=1 Tax=Mycobacterium sp. TaxID=1785 RepID=UPI003F989D28